MDTTIERSALEGKLLPELQQIAQTLGVEGTQKLRKAGLIDAIVSLCAWLIARLEETYPALRAPKGPGTNTTLARYFVETHRILPILDGLDEMPDSMRPAALRAISVESTVPLVITSRPDE